MTTATQSRNQREGRYVGVFAGRHSRVRGAQHHRAGAIPEPFMSYYCTECHDGSAVQFVVSSGVGDHHEFGHYLWWDGVSICTCCGARQSWDDASI